MQATSELVGTSPVNQFAAVPQSPPATLVQLSVHAGVAWANGTPTGPRTTSADATRHSAPNGPNSPRMESGLRLTVMTSLGTPGGGATGRAALPQRSDDGAGRSEATDGCPRHRLALRHFRRLDPDLPSAVRRPPSASGPRRGAIATSYPTIPQLVLPRWPRVHWLDHRRSAWRASRQSLGVLPLSKTAVRHPK